MFMYREIVLKLTVIVILILPIEFCAGNNFNFQLKKLASFLHERGIVLQ